MKTLSLLLGLVGSLCITLAAQESESPRVHKFHEIWGYLMKGEERMYPDNAPFTDIGYFSARVNADGKLEGGPTERPALTGPNEKAPRIHLVVTTPWNSDLMHLFLSPELPLRQRIINGIVERSKPFDGVQIDFESIKPADKEQYLSFLREVRKALPKDKIMSVAVMARWKSWVERLKNDPFHYPTISGIADRVIVMAYDEHSRGSDPGAIASMEWCKKIADYATSTIPEDKLVMGVPLYGRAWQTEKLEKALRHHQAMEIANSKGIPLKRNAMKGANFKYQQMVTITVFFEDLISLNAKLYLYSRLPTCGVAFWRIGQEPKGTWDLIRKD